MRPFSRVSGRYVFMANREIDTDQIIPAVYLQRLGKEGLGPFLFRRRRYTEDGSPRQDFPLNQPEARGAQILVAGANFGSGSSREHAVWALMDFGFRVVISTSIADIFRGNALKNGLLAIDVEEGVHRIFAERLFGWVEVCLETKTLLLDNRERFGFEIDSFAAHCLRNGISELDFILGHEAEIDLYETKRWIDN